MQDNLDDLRHIEGFPLGEDEDLHALSDPPHYTAYPNPHLADFIAQYGTPYDEATDDYHREPYVSDVSEGKNDPIYNAHSYHTKVPYKAIIPFIEHYTEPGDLVFDGFCGTGMTGIAAQMAGRRAILCDLSPAASFIAYNYNTPVDVNDFRREINRILTEVEATCGWLYRTEHPNGGSGIINFIGWSDVFTCPYCDGEIVFWDVAVDNEAKKIRKKFACPNCNAVLTKKDIVQATEFAYDNTLGREIELARRLPVFINYSVGRSRHKKKFDSQDLALLNQIEQSEIPYWHPTHEMPEGYNTEQPRRSHGITHVHHFFSKRELWTLSALWDAINRVENKRTRASLIMPFTTMLLYCSFMRRFRPDGKGGGPLSGTLYVSSLSTPLNPIISYRRNSNTLLKALTKTSKLKTDNGIVSTQSVTSGLQSAEGEIDYVFTDPPFGNNIMYSELNFVWESWLQVFTNNKPEAIMNNVQRKTLDNYRGLMTQAFIQMYKALKPGHWITVVFHNSKSSVWNAIQEALAKAGFLVAQVTVMDKQQGSFKQVTAAGAVKNDLVINAYKPRHSFVQKFTAQAGQGLEADFIRQHLEQLPKAANVERTKEMLYSKCLAYYVQHGYQVAYNGEQFYRALPQWGFVEQDGYWFSDERQVQAYHQAVAAQEVETAPQPPLFIFDERSAIQWLKHFLHGRPASLSDIQPEYLQALQPSKDLIPDLRELLDENFGRPDRQGRYHWPNPQLQAELDEARHHRLTRLFNDYLKQAQAGQRLKEVRKEALTTGFTEAYRAGRFQDILTVGHKLPKKLLEENLDLFDFVEIAEAKLEG